MRTELARLQKDTASKRRREKDLKGRLVAQQKALAAERAKAASLSSEAASLKKQATRLQKEKAEREAAAAQLAASVPTIEIIEPQLPRTRTAGLPTIAVQGGDSKTVVGRVNAPTGLMALMINDVDQEIGEDGMFRASVPLPKAENKVTVIAIDKKGRRIETAFLVTRPVGAVRNASGVAPQLAAEKLDVSFGKFHAVVIGNNDYGLLPKLETAAEDARAVAELLETRYGHQVTLIVNANRYAILSALNKLRESLTEDDNLLIYYAGHGELDRVNNRGHWLPVDAEPDSSANWISNIQITDVLNAMTVRQVLVVADSCYSGTLTRSAVAKLDAGMNEQTRNNWIKLMADKRARVVLVRQANWQKVGGASPPERRSNRTTFLREPCVGSREGAGEASVAAWMGKAIEHRKSDGPGCRGFQIGRRQYRRRRFGEMSASPAVSENPCTFARLLLGPWEVFKLPRLS